MRDWRPQQDELGFVTPEEEPASNQPTGGQVRDTKGKGKMVDSEGPSLAGTDSRLDGEDQMRSEDGVSNGDMGEGQAAVA